MTRNEIYKAIDAERERQKELHGTRGYSNEEYLTILIEEVGEVAKAMQSIPNAQSVSLTAYQEFISELIQCAAVIVQWLKAR